MCQQCSGYKLAAFLPFKSLNQLLHSIYMSVSLRPKPFKSPNQEETELYDRVTKLQTKILDRLSHLKKDKKYLECKHLENVPDKCEDYESGTNYYDKFWKTFLINEISHSRIEDLEHYLECYEDKIEQVQQLLQRHEQLTGVQGRRKSRRPAELISKQKQCPYPKCFKVYGTDVSLNLHIKLKHNGGNKTDRQKAAELIWQAKERGKPIPQFYINLPPNFVQDYGKMTERIGGQRREEES